MEDASNRQANIHATEGLQCLSPNYISKTNACQDRAVTCLSPQGAAKMNDGDVAVLITRSAMDA